MLTNVKFYNRFWRDNKVKTLSANGKYLFGYFISSPYNNELGLYYIPLTSIAHDTGLDNLIVKKEIINLINNGLVKYDFENEIVFVQNFLRFNGENGQIDIDNVKTILECLPETSLVNDFLASCQKNNKYLLDEEIEDLKNNFRPVIRGMEMEEQCLPIIEEDSTTNKEEKEVFINEEKMQEAEKEEKDAISVNETKPLVNEEEQKVVEEKNTKDEDVASYEENNTSIEETSSDVKNTVVDENTVNENFKETDEKEVVSASKEKEKAKRLEVYNSILEIFPFAPDLVGFKKKNAIKTGEKNFLKLLEKGDAEIEELQLAVETYVEDVKEKCTAPQYYIQIYNFFGRAKKYKEYLPDDPDKVLTKLSLKEITKLNEGFERFFAIYPKKEGKEEAKRFFKLICVKGMDDMEDVIASAKAYADACFVKHTELQYIMKANNFLNIEKKPYRDYINSSNNYSINNTFSVEMPSPIMPTHTEVTPIPEIPFRENNGEMVMDDDDFFEKDKEEKQENSVTPEEEKNRDFEETEEDNEDNENDEEENIEEDDDGKNEMLLNPPVFDEEFLRKIEELQAKRRQSASSDEDEDNPFVVKDNPFEEEDDDFFTNTDGEEDDEDDENPFAEKDNDDTHPW